MNKKKLLRKAQAGGRNMSFVELVALAEGFGFVLDRVNGSHHILFIRTFHGS